MRYQSAFVVLGLVLAMPAAAQSKDDDWSGFYIGADAGGSSERMRTSGSDFIAQLSNIFVPGRGIVVVPGTSRASDGRDTDTTFIYGGMIGGQWQTGGVILGLEGDLHGPRNFSGFVNAVALPPTILAPASNLTIARSARMSYDWSARFRVGVAIGSRSMIYANGGVAGARVRLTGQDSFTTPAGAAATGGGVAAFVSPTIGPVVITASERRNLIGWTAGFGGETKLSKSIGIGLDARYTDYGSHNFDLAAGCTPATAGSGPCASVSRTSPPIVINGATLNPATDVTPGIVPGSTRADFRDLRLTARIVFHF